MCRALALLAVLALAPLSSGCSDAAASPRQLLADQVLRATGPASEFNLFLLLNGDLTKLGVLTATATSVTNATTSSPFTVLPADCPARVFKFQCDTAQVNIGAGSTCSAAITNANFRDQIANAWEPRWLITSSTTICAAIAAGTVNCAVFCMK